MSEDKDGNQIVMAWIVSPPNTYIEALTPKVSIFGARAHEKVRLSEVIFLYDWYPYKKRHQGCAFTEKRTCGDTARRWLSAS